MSGLLPEAPAAYDDAPSMFNHTLRCAACYFEIDAEPLFIINSTRDELTVHESAVLCCMAAVWLRLQVTGALIHSCRRYPLLVYERHTASLPTPHRRCAINAPVTEPLRHNTVVPLPLLQFRIAAFAHVSFKRQGRRNSAASTRLSIPLSGAGTLLWGLADAAAAGC